MAVLNKCIKKANAICMIEREKIKERKKKQQAAHGRKCIQRISTIHSVNMNCSFQLAGIARDPRDGVNGPVSRWWCDKFCLNSKQMNTIDNTMVYRFVCISLKLFLWRTVAWYEYVKSFVQKKICSELSDMFSWQMLSIQIYKSVLIEIVNFNRISCFPAINYECCEDISNVNPNCIIQHVILDAFFGLIHQLLTSYRVHWLSLVGFECLTVVRYYF